MKSNLARRQGTHAHGSRFKVPAHHDAHGSRFKVPAHHDAHGSRFKVPAHHVTAWLILPMRATARPNARGRIPGGFMRTAFEVMVGVKSDGAVGAQGGGGGGGRDSLADRALAACIVHVIKAAPTRVDYLRPILGNHVYSEAITISAAT